MVQYLERVSYLCLLAAVVVRFWLMPCAPYLMGAGALGVFLCQWVEKQTEPQRSLRARRLLKIRYLRALFYGMCAYYMWKTQRLDWLPFLCIGVVIECYTLFAGEKE